MNTTVGIAALALALATLLTRNTINRIPLHVKIRWRFLQHHSPLLKLLAFLPLPLTAVSAWVLFPATWRLQAIFARYAILYIMIGLHIAILHLSISKDPGGFGRGPQFLIIFLAWPFTIFKYLNDLWWRFIM